jgi:hypothetical protein
MLQQVFTRSLTLSRVVAACGAALLLAAASPARADSVDTQQWTIFTLDKDLSKRWMAYFEVQPRFGQNISVLEQAIVRPAIGYRVNKKLSLWQGYGFTPQFDPAYNNEHRVYQQVLFQDTLGKTGLTSRTRLEERFIHAAGGTSVRLRTMLRLQYPISADKRWALVGYDEIFWNLNSTPNGPDSGFDQNRLFAGVSRQVNPELRVETGYLLNHRNTPRSSDNRKLDVWVVQFAFRL